MVLLGARSWQLMPRDTTSSPARSSGEMPSCCKVDKHFAIDETATCAAKRLDYIYRGKNRGHVSRLLWKETDQRVKQPVEATVVGET